MPLTHYHLSVFCGFVFYSWRMQCRLAQGGPRALRRAAPGGEPTHCPRSLWLNYARAKTVLSERSMRALWRAGIQAHE